MALEDQNRETLLEKIGVEPTGDPFNSVIRLDENSKRPDNPMVKVFEDLSEEFDLHLFDSPLEKCSFLEISKNKKDVVSKVIGNSLKI